jgi:hypothetical protein
MRLKDIILQACRKNDTELIGQAVGYLRGRGVDYEAAANMFHDIAGLDRHGFERHMAGYDGMLNSKK